MIRLKSSEGYSLDFQIFNLFGFTYYTISNIHYMYENDISFNSIMDLVFSSHALLITIVLLILTFLYPRKSNNSHPGTYLMILILFIFSFIYGYSSQRLEKHTDNDIWIFMGMGKSIVSTLKYLY